jgi:hypothetical protein
MSNTPKTESTPSKGPAYIAYQIRGKEGEKGYFTRIGAAWPQKTGKGFNIQLDAVPLDGRIALCLPSEAKK